MIARAVVMLIAAALVAASPALATEDLNPAAYHHVTFEKISPTLYERDGDALRMTVKKSASFLLRGFDTVRKVQHIHFAWRTDSKPLVATAEAERTKSGDDCLLKIGLLETGDAPLIPFFAAAWIKAIRDFMRIPSDHALFLVPGSLAPAGFEWPSPYSDNLTMHSTGPGLQRTDGLRQVDVALAKPRTVVGLWLMADGDDTGSSFTTELRNLIITP